MSKKESFSNCEFLWTISSNLYFILFTITELARNGLGRFYCPHTLTHRTPLLSQPPSGRVARSITSQTERGNRPLTFALHLYIAGKTQSWHNSHKIIIIFIVKFSKIIQLLLVWSNKITLMVLGYLCLGNIILPNREPQDDCCTGLSAWTCSTTIGWGSNLLSALSST